MNPAQNAIDRVREADREAEASAMAFVLGDFENYIQRRADEAIARMEKKYEFVNGESTGQHNDGAEHGSESGGDGGPSTDAA